MGNPLRVAAIILEYHPIVGGAQRQLARLTHYFPKSEIELQIFTRRSPGLEKKETIDGIVVHRLPAPGPKLLAAPLFILSTLLALRKFKPDVIHAFSLFSPLTAAIWAKRLWGTPVVCKLLRGGLLGDVQRLQRKINGRQRLAAYRRHVDGFIVISKEIQEELSAIGVQQEQRIFLPNGVDTDDIKPVDAQAKRRLRLALQLPDGPLVIYTGRFVPAKQLPQLLLAWKEILIRFPEAHLLLLGDGPQGRELQAMNPGQVVFGGRVEDVKPYLQAADIFILPSATEGLSNSLLEGMAAGLPVIATAVGGAPDAIHHGLSGWLIDPNAVDELRLALITLLSRPELRAMLGKNGRRQVTQTYAISQTAANHLFLYRYLAAGRPLKDLTLPQTVN